jgi:predicted flap endonuclease-1-like 5' DNA nuclease
MALLPVAGLAAGTMITHINGQRKASKRDNYIKELEGDIDTRDRKIESLNKSLQEHKTAFQGLNMELSHRDSIIRDLEDQVWERDENVDSIKTDIAKLRREIQETMDRAVGAEGQLYELQMLLQERKQEVTDLKAKLQGMQDDFSHLEGVGPKISATLRSAGVKTFAKLAAKDVGEIKEILMAKYPRLLKLSDPTTWPEQAEMAAEGRWENLKTLKESLRERRHRERAKITYT